MVVLLGSDGNMRKSEKREKHRYTWVIIIVFNIVHGFLLFCVALFGFV